MAIGVVAAAVPDGVFPVALSASFRRSQSFVILSNRYKNGEYQASTLGQTSSRKVWELSSALTSAQLTELREFFDDHDGASTPFTFFDPYDVAATAGFVVRFDAPWQQEVAVGRRGSVPMRLIEVA